MRRRCLEQDVAANETITQPIQKRDGLPRKKKRLCIWCKCLWKNGNILGRTVWVLLAFLIPVIVFVNSPHQLFFASTQSDRVLIARQDPYIHGTTTIHIPMENFPENEPPSRVLFRFLESGPRKRLRKTGIQALIQLGNQLRQLVLLGDGIMFHPHISATDSLKMERFHLMMKEIAPWLRGDPGLEVTWPLNQVPSPYDADPNSRAVVICAGDRELAHLDALLHQIRKIHKSKIPIRIAYQGDPDLSPKARQALASRYTSESGSLKFINLSALFALDHRQVQLSGENLKPFGMLAVPEAQVVLLDVDVLLFRPPEELFELVSYKETGALFFRDLGLGETLWTPRQFVLSLQPKLSKEGRNALVNGKVFNEHIQDGGVVAIDKFRRWRALWTACLILGRQDIRRFVQRDIISGEKEVYFAAFETIEEPYAFAKYYPGVIGSVVSDFHGDELEWAVDTLPNQIDKKIYQLGPYMALCGRKVHFDDQGLPLWSSGAYSYYGKANRGIKPLLFIPGGDSATEGGGNGGERNQNWRFHQDLRALCLFSNKRSIQTLPPEYAARGVEAVGYYMNTTGPAYQ